MMCWINAFCEHVYFMATMDGIFFLSFKPSKRTLQMIFLIISSSFGERFKLKTSFSLNDNMMAELMVYYVTERVLPARRFAF